MSSPENSHTPNPESIQRFNDLVDQCLKGVKPFDIDIDGEQEIASADLPLPDQIYVHTDDFISDEAQIQNITREYSVKAERHLSAARAIRRLRLVDRSREGSYPLVLESFSDKPGITFRYENPIHPEQEYTLDSDFLDSQLDRVDLGIQFKQAGH